MDEKVYFSKGVKQSAGQNGGLFWYIS